MTNGSVAIGIIGAGIMGERLIGAILQQDPELVHACGLWDPSPEAMRRSGDKATAGALAKEIEVTINEGSDVIEC